MVNSEARTGGRMDDIRRGDQVDGTRDEPHVEHITSFDLEIRLSKAGMRRLALESHLMVARELMSALTDPYCNEVAHDLVDAIINEISAIDNQTRINRGLLRRCLREEEVNGASAAVYPL